MSREEIQHQAQEACVQITNALAAIALEREALQRDRRLDPGLIAHTIARYQETINEHLHWLNTHGFVASVSGEVLSVQKQEEVAAALHAASSAARQGENYGLIFAGRRVENLGENVASWSERTGNGSSTWDLCLPCARKLEREPHCFDTILVPYNGDPPGEKGRGGDCAHPSYQDDEYRCALPTCQALLIDER